MIYLLELIGCGLNADDAFFWLQVIGVVHQARQTSSLHGLHKAFAEVVPIAASTEGPSSFRVETNSDNR
jgi:hypothetical protein